MYNEPSLIGCMGFHHIPPVCGFALWGSISGLITNQQDLLSFLNGNYRRLDDDYHSPVIDTLNDPPASPADGDRYIVGCTPTGDWVGQEGNIAEWKTTPHWGGANPGGTWGNTACGSFGYIPDEEFDSTWQTANRWHFTEPEDGSVVFSTAPKYQLTFLDFGNSGEGGGGMEAE